MIQFKKIENSGLSKYFSKIITSEEAGVKKPNPIIFEYALQQTNAISSESIMIGDNWEADIMGALDFGMEAICFNYHKETLGADIIGVDHLVELKKYI